MHRWQERVREIVNHELSVTTLAAFNTNVDAVVHLTNEHVAELCQDPQVSLDEVNKIASDDILEIHTANEFVAVLKGALGYGKSSYVILRNHELLDWLDEKFPSRRASMGGQAGVIANQMAALGARSLVYTSLLSQKQVDMFFPAVQVPVVDNGLKVVPVGEAVNPSHQTKVNWIFEYPKNAEYDFCGETVRTPRANRVIVATRPAGVVMGFSDEIAPHLPELGQKIDVAFLAGYHYASPDPESLNAYLKESMASVHSLKEANPKLRLHYEYVPMSDENAEKTVLKTIAQEIQSFGINENEIKRVLSEFGFQGECEAIASDERAFCLYRGVLCLSKALGFERIQLHNLGYYVLVLKKPYAIDPELVRDACLFASSVNAIKAKYGGYVKAEQLAEAGEIPLSDIGLEQLRLCGVEMRSMGIELPEDFETTGIADMGDHYLLVVPAHVVPNPVSTVGMGDTISSSSYAYECKFHTAGRIIG
ncbi:MAG TPA: hypothetical protein GX008_01465 [Firmicutes bacterium]|nr:MAG: hypothetical protein AA931_06805 [Peptococcaceae bacterium 1109]HHT72362.1 hypothetical protein [Bacillota bacterium]